MARIKHIALTTKNPDQVAAFYKEALREVVWVISSTCGYDGMVRSPAACR